MDLEFGNAVSMKAKKLAEDGKDPNQTAKILFDQDDKGFNYGIGVILTGKGRPMETSPTLLGYIRTELGSSGKGSYMNSAKALEDLKTEVLKWQRVPEEHWGSFILSLPSDAGTGAVKSAIETSLVLDPSLTTLGIEELGWPAYKAMAKVARLSVRESPSGEPITGKRTLALYQAGPMNTTGAVPSRDTVNGRAENAAKSGARPILDRAYSGFEYARLTGSASYDEIMKKSYRVQIAPYIEQGSGFCLALSPTKCFVTFALRPCGFFLVYEPDGSRLQQVRTAVNQVLRARGSAFEHPVSRAFVKAMIKDRAKLEEEHLLSLKRLAGAEAMWKKYVKGTAIEYLYSDDYAGLFRNPRAKDTAAVHIYNEHIYPVLSGGRCRQNITGIPDDEELAKQHVAVFAGQCL